MRRNALLAAAVVAVASGVSSAATFFPFVIYSDVVTAPTSDVPGVGGKFSSFDKPFLSPDGTFWVITADTDLATTQDEVLIRGSGISGTVVVQEGVTKVPDGSPDLFGFIDTRTSVNDSGDVVFSGDTSGATTADEMILRYSDAGGGTYSIVAREGEAVPGVAGEVFGAVIDSALILNGGSVGFRATSTVGSLPTTADDFVFLGSTIVAQAGVTAPTGGGGRLWQTFDLGDYWVSADGSSYLLRGDLDGTSTTDDDVVVVDGSVVLQEAAVIPGSSFASPIASGGPDEVFMSHGGDWMARGNNVDGDDWVVYKGSVVAKRGDAVPGSPGEFYSDAVFSDTFFFITANGAGDYVFGATTSNSDPAKDGVLVYNAVLVIARQGDMVDLNADGIMNDDAFINIFNNDDGVLSDDGRFYFTADLVNAAGTGIGQAFMTFVVPEPGALALVGMGALLAARRRR